MIHINKIKLIAKSLYNDRGQTSVEYLLIIGVVVAITVSALANLRAILVGNDGECTQNSRNFLCRIESRFADPNLKFYTIPR